MSHVSKIYIPRCTRLQHRGRLVHGLKYQCKLAPTTSVIIVLYELHGLGMSGTRWLYDLTDIRSYLRIKHEPLMVRNSNDDVSVMWRVSDADNRVCRQVRRREW